MVFEVSDGSFGGVAAIRMWWHQLVINVFLSEKLLEIFGGFIVKFLEQRLETVIDKGLVQVFENLEHFGTGIIFKRMCDDRVAIVFIHHHDVLVALA